MFELFDPRSEVAIREGKLPHWFQPGVTYFVTFRTEDSVPQSLTRKWHAQRAAWLLKHGIDLKSSDWRFELQQSPQIEREYHQRFTREFMDYLDRGHGACPFANSEAAELVASALHHFDGDRYILGDYVVMPNHVHLLVGLMGPTEIEAQCRSWKKFSAQEINLLLGRNGRFWQEESFDHLVRSPEQFEYFQRYIADNPLKAGLRPGQYLHYRRPK